MAKTYFVTEYDGKKSIHVFPDDVTMSEFFGHVSKAIAYSDCTDDDIIEIVFRGERFGYQSWQPRMLFTYVGSNGNTWEGCYPWFDH